MRARGIKLKVAKLDIDTSTPYGMYFYTMRAAGAELERKILSQRTKEGMEAARKRGARIGRPPSICEAKMSEARRMIAKGDTSIAAVAKSLSVNRWTLSRRLKRETAAA